MNKFRNPYVSCVLAMLLLFTSCSQFENDIEEIDSSLSLKEYVEKHISLTNELYHLLQNQENVNITLFDDLPQNIEFNQLKIIFENANLSNANLATEIIKKIDQNNNNFIKVNSDLRYSEIENIVTNEIEYQFLNTELLSSRQPTCLEQYHIDKQRCLQNLLLATSVAGIVAVFSAGIGGAVGIAAALTQNLICNGNADNDYNACIAQ